MKKVYADRSLPYTQSARFQFPENADLCSEGDGVLMGDSSIEGTTVNGDESGENTDDVQTSMDDSFFD